MMDKLLDAAYLIRKTLLLAVIATIICYRSITMQAVLRLRLAQALAANNAKGANIF